MVTHDDTLKQLKELGFKCCHGINASSMGRACTFKSFDTQINFNISDTSGLWQYRYFQNKLWCWGFDDGVWIPTDALDVATLMVLYK